MIPSRRRRRSTGCAAGGPHGAGRFAAAAAALGLLVLQAAGAAGQELPPAYAALARRYASGDRSGAVAELAAWPEWRVKALGRDLNLRAALAERPGPGQRCLLPDCAAFPARAALLLHTDAAARRRAGGASARLHDVAAIELARFLAAAGVADPAAAEARAGRAFVERWYVAVTLDAQQDTRWSDALDWAERGLKPFPESPDLLLALASLEEVLAFQAVAPPGDGLHPPPLDRIEREAGEERGRASERRRHLARARQALDAALRAGPRRDDVRVRLGRVAWKLGDAAASRAVLEPVAERRDAEPSLAYLARLFLGRLLEDEGRLEEAARSYEAAIATRVRSQAAGLALSHVRLRLGDSASARLQLEGAIRAAGYQAGADPFWLYPWGAAPEANARLEALRREASEPAP